MTYVLVIVTLILSLYGTIRTKQKEKNEYAGYEKYDADPKWIIKHVLIIVLMLLMSIYFLFYDPGERTTNILICLIFAFFIAYMISDIIYDTNRYIYVKGNKLVSAVSFEDGQKVPFSQVTEGIVLTLPEKTVDLAASLPPWKRVSA